MKIPVPMARLQELLDAADFSEDYREAIGPGLDLLLAKKEEFADHLEKVFSLIPYTRLFIEHEEVPGRLKKVWAYWYETILSGKGINELLIFLWRIGLRHVEVNLDQSYTNAGFSLARNFIHDILEGELPAKEAFRAARAVDRLIDLCLLVETVAYIENLSHCDMDIMGGIADKVRNPATIIGGNIRRLMKKSPAGSEHEEIFKDIIDENARLERMVGNIKKYIEMFRREPDIMRVSLTKSLEKAMVRLKQEGPGLQIPKIDVRVDPDAGFVTGSPVEVEDMFFYLMLSCLEDPGYAGGTITITTEPDEIPSRQVCIKVHCPGSHLRADDSDRVVHPFYSKGSEGTGFGLPTALLAVRKNHGRFQIMDADGDGAYFVVALPSAD